MWSDKIAEKSWNTNVMNSIFNYLENYKLIPRSYTLISFTEQNFMSIFIKCILFEEKINFLK